MANKTVAAVVKLIDEFTNPSKAVNTAAKNMEKRISEVGDKFKAVGAVFDSVGSAMSKTITAPIVAAGTAAFKFASDSENAFQSFAAVTGTTADEMERYKDIINEIYAQDFGESMDDVANSLAIVKQNMSRLDDKSLSGVTKYALTLSDALGMDVAESSRAAETMIKNFGISATQAFNLIAQGSQNGLDYSGEMIDSINEYSVQFQKLGMDADDMFSIFANGVENGAFNLDKIGDAVKEFSIRAIDGSDTTAEGFKALGMNADEMAKKFAAGGEGAKEAFEQVIGALADMDDPVEQSIAGVNLFGTMWEDLGPQVVTSLSTMSNSIDSTKNSMDELVNTKYNTLSSAMSSMWRTIQTDVLQPIGKQLIPYVSKAIDKINQLTKWWNKLEPATQKNIVKFAGIAAAIGPALLAFGKLHTGIGNAITSFGNIKAATMKAGGAMKLIFSPANKVILLIAGVAAVAYLVYKNWDKIVAAFEKVKAAMGRFIEVAGEKINSAIETFSTFVSYVWDTFQTKVSEAISKVQEVFGNIVDFLKDTWSSGVQLAMETVGEYIDTWKTGIDTVIESVKGIMNGIVDFINNVFSGNWKGAWESLKNIVGNAFSGLEALVKTPINAVIGLVNKAIGAINNISVDVPSFAQDIIGTDKFGFNIPTIPPLSTGTDNWKGGIAQISERGGEIVDLPSGSRVYPHDESVRMAREEGQKTISITLAKLADQIIVREDADIDRLAEAFAKKLVSTAANMA